MSNCQIKVQQGVIQGKECVTYYGKKYYSFEGIPYAKPPVGKLRFRNPEEPDSWTGVRDATKPGNKCIQLNPYSSSAIQGSEDCLYLNIYTPNLPCERLQKLPVIFFIHGGRLIFGHGDYQQPDYLLRQDVIVVTLNFRLSIFGFLCLNIPEVPGNVALKDTIFALKWVNRNIEKFNGDLSNVTVMGESAGAAMASSYLTSKMADGLFSKIIAISGVSVADMFIIDEDPVEKGKQIATILGRDLNDPKEIHEYLLNVSADDLIYAFTTAEISRPPSILNAYFLPVIEKKFDGIDAFFEEHPILSIRENRFSKVPVIIGYNSHEGATFLRKDDEGRIILEEEFYFFIPKNLFVEEGSTRAKKLQKQIKEFYFKNKKLKDATDDYVNLVSDTYFNKDFWYFPELAAKFSDQIYMYYFEYCGNMNTRVMGNLGMKGAAHGDLMMYLFYKKEKAAKCTEKDQKIIDFLTESFCNFAKNGTPTWSNQKTKWLPYTNTMKQTLVINEELKLVEKLHWDRVQFWLDILSQRSKL